jgi:hypothetical protein
MKNIIRSFSTGIAYELHATTTHVVARDRVSTDHCGEAAED